MSVARGYDHDLLPVAGSVLVSGGWGLRSPVPFAAVLRSGAGPVRVRGLGRWVRYFYLPDTGGRVSGRGLSGGCGFGRVGVACVFWCRRDCMGGDGQRLGV